jgi:GTPase-activating protein BEM2
VATSISAQCARHQSSDAKDIDRLASIEKEVSVFPIDARAIREEASREALIGGIPPSGKKSARPFQRLVTTQIEKTRRDKALRERIAKAKRQEQLRLDKREETLNRALHIKSPSSSAQKQHRTKKSMSTAFFQLMRPLSTAFTTDAHVAKRTPKELDFPNTGKPALVLSLAGARVSQFVNYERSFTFQIDTEDGGNYLLQAIDKREMLKWIDTIQRISHDGAKRRSTYTGISPQPHLSDHILVPSPSRDPRAGESPSFWSCVLQTNFLVKFLV